VPDAKIAKLGVNTTAIAATNILDSRILGIPKEME
jgi:hypothetical protein